MSAHSQGHPPNDFGQDDYRTTIILRHYEVMAKADSGQQARSCGIFSNPAGDASERAMKSSAMREMMALTERPDVISLAGGLPDTSTFEPELYATLMARVAAESTARKARRDGGSFDR